MAEPLVHGFGALVAITLAACSTPTDVRTQSAETVVDRPTTTTTTTTATERTPDTDPAGNEPGAGEPVDHEPSAPSTLPPRSGDGLVFELENLTVEVTRRTTTADLPPHGYDGFMSAVQLDDGSFVASGFDSRSQGAQPERAAIWRSDDGSSWQRVGDSIGARPGQQQVAALYVDDGEVHLLETGLDVFLEDDGTTVVEFGLTGEWTSDDGAKWASQTLVGNNMIGGVERIDGEIVAFGAARPNSEGDFAASIIRPPEGGGDWTAEEIVDASGAVFPASFIADMHTVGDTIVAVGATAHTDPLSNVVGTLINMLSTNGASDVAIWRSTDSGTTWNFISTDTFTGKSGPALATKLVEVNGWLYMLTTTVEGFQTTVVLHRSDDLGDTWERVRFDKALASGVGSSTGLTNYGLYGVDGYLVLLEERFGLSQNMFMTVIDPVSGDSIAHSLTDELGVVQVEDILDVDGGAIGFGRTERGTLASDLQVIDIRAVDPSAPSAPTTTVPATPTSPTPSSNDAFEPVAAELDPFGYRRARPRAATALEPQWTIESPGFVVRGAVAVDDVIVYSMIESGNVHQVYGVDRETGSARWQEGRDGQQIAAFELVAGVIVVDWMVTERGRETVGYDAETGAQLWSIDDIDGYFTLPPASSEHIVRSRLDDVFDRTLFDPVTGDVIGSFLPVGSSADTRTTGIDQQVVELDTATLTPLGAPIPLGRDLFLRSNVAVLESRVVTLGAGVLNVFDLSGEVTAEIPLYGVGTESLTPVRPDSNQVVLTVDDEVIGFDAEALEVTWLAEAEGVEVFGAIDGEMYGLLQAAGTTKLVSLETGALRCSLDGVRKPEMLRHGFLDGNTAYGLDCKPTWTAPDGDVTLVDAGVLSSTKVEDHVEITLLE